eukprot:162130-Rhodomonas_salina.1
MPMWTALIARDSTVLAIRVTDLRGGNEAAVELTERWRCLLENDMDRSVEMKEEQELRIAAEKEARSKDAEIQAFRDKVPPQCRGHDDALVDVVDDFGGAGDDDGLVVDDDDRDGRFCFPLSYHDGLDFLLNLNLAKTDDVPESCNDH